MAAPAESSGAAPIGDDAEGGARRPETIRKRRDFLAAARARRAPAASLILQGRRRGPEEAGEAPRVGYTCSRKVGNAVARNRAKRRLRAAATEIIAREGRPGWDYVLIGRAEATARRPWEELLADLRGALARVHAPKGRK